MRFLLPSLFVLTPFLALAEVPTGLTVSQEKDRESIKKLAGCYEVDFQYQETFPLLKDYKIKPGYRARALEWMVVDEKKDDKISLQNILIVGDDMIIKHWRHEWKYNQPSHWEFVVPGHWKQVGPFPKAEGTWTQSVGHVDDSPRYACQAPWVHWKNHDYWECETDAPLPRRESARDDYNVLRRKNRHDFLSLGHVHEETNTKIKREKGKGDIALVKESGQNSYKKVEDAKCAVAQKWWAEHKPFWDIVRTVWKEHLETKEKNFYLKSKVNGTPLYSKLFEMDEEVTKAGGFKEENVLKQVRETIKPYLGE